jgi:hypothetical protein
MLDSDQLRSLIIKPALTDLIMYSDEAVELLIFTCANESNGGTYLKQISGPALGIYQMEPTTYNDIWQNYIMKNSSILLRFIHGFGINSMPSEERLIYDLRFATAMARIHYERVKQPLPAIYDLDGIWNYYKQYYNTCEGKADYHDAINRYQVFRNA